VKTVDIGLVSYMTNDSIVLYEVQLKLRKSLLDNLIRTIEVGTRYPILVNLLFGELRMGQ
jgi:hypothetical protein